MDKIKKVYNIGILSDSNYYKIVFLLWALFHNLSFGARYSGYLSYFMIIWGVLLLIRNVLIEKTKVPKMLIYLIYAFLISYVITIIINRNFNLIGNIKTLIWSTISTLVLFINEYSNDNKKIYRDINIISKFLVIIISIISLISILMFMFDISYFTERIDGRMIPQGYYAARLWGIYVDPNQGCTIGIVGLTLALVLFIQKKVVSRSVLIISIIINYIFIILTGSRGGEIALIVAFIGLVYMLFDYLLRNKLRRYGLRKVLSVFIGMFITICIVLSFDNTRKLLSCIPRATLETQEYINNTTGIQSGGSGGNVTVERPDKKTSNGRIELWTDGFKLSKYAPIFGFGDRNIMLKAKELTPGSSLENQYVHNGFIHMLLGGGIVPLIIMIIFITIIAIESIRILFGNKKYVKQYYIYSIISLTIVELLITAVFLTEIFYQNSFIATIFWILLGYVVVISDENKMIQM